MNVNNYTKAAQQFQHDVAQANIQVPENIDALCYAWLEQVLSDVELKAAREIGLKLLAIIRGITQ